MLSMALDETYLHGIPTGAGRIGRPSCRPADSPCLSPPTGYVTDCPSSPAVAATSSGTSASRQAGWCNRDIVHAMDHRPGLFGQTPEVLICPEHIAAPTAFIASHLAAWRTPEGAIPARLLDLACGRCRCCPRCAAVCR